MVSAVGRVAATSLWMDVIIRVIAFFDLAGYLHHMLSDQCHRLLHLLGWSTGEAAFRRPDGSRYWQVDCAREDQVILATGPTQRSAWALAVRLVGRLTQATDNQT